MNVIFRQRRIIVLSLILGLLLLPGFSNAQNFRRQFRDAKDAFDNGDYAKALADFKPLIEYDKENPYSQYASYYYGLSAVRMRFGTVAKDIFLQTRKLYPDWEHIDEVNYLLAGIYFDQHEYFRAMLMLQDIKNQSMAADINIMKRYYLAAIGDAETLRMMLEEYPQEVETARALVKAIALEPIAQQDTRLFDSLIVKYQFDRKDFVTENVLVSKKKERYTISLLLPFLTSTLEPSPVVKRNQYVLDMYVGMKMAVDTLAKQGVNLDVFAYDTERTVETTKRLLTMEEVLASDLLVGPLFADQTKVVLEFSEKNKIDMINPVTNNSEFIGQNPFAFLYQPSQETLGIRSAEKIASRVKNKNCIVYFSDSPRDSVKAFSFMRKALDLGLRIVLAEEVRKENSSKIFSSLATGTEFDEFKNPTQFTLKRDSVGSIYVATDDPVIYTKVISGVEVRGDSVLIVGNESWIAEDNTSVDFGIYDRLNILLEAPNFVSATDPGYIDFRKKYIRQHGTMPSDYARMGYDFMHFVGQSLQRHGVYFQLGLSQEPEPVSSSTSRYNFRNARDNQQVQYVTFHRGELVLAEDK